MDIGKIGDDFTYYEGYEDDTEIVLYLGDIAILHIWKGYFDDILDTPPLDGNGLVGFTRDYHQFERVFSNKNSNGGAVRINPKEYLDDLLQYKGKKFDFEETAHVLDTIVDVLCEAIKQNLSVAVEEI